MGQSKLQIKKGFINAQQMAMAYPDSFEAPDLKDLDKLKPGNTVKVCHLLNEYDSERFWCIIQEIKGNTIKAVVDNDLFHNHGFDDTDTVTFNKHDIYNIYASH